MYILACIYLAVLQVYNGTRIRFLQALWLYTIEKQSIVFIFHWFCLQSEEYKDDKSLFLLPVKQFIKNQIVCDNFSKIKTISN